jgi:serine/threonine protein phosphatase PrpC
MRIGAGTHAGRIRRTNEDTYHANASLLVVADGMGGHAAGEVASGLAVATLTEQSNWDNPAETLRSGLIDANKRILQRSLSNPAYAGMGTTITAAHVSGRYLYYAHVGDSRLYLFRSGVLSRVTRDHSVVGELLRIGGLTESEARVHPQRNVLTRALGMESDIEIDGGKVEVFAGDRLLLCTDGLHDVVRNEDIARVLAEVPDPRLAVAQLIHLANTLGGHDNITAVLADMTGEEER